MSRGVRRATVPLLFRRISLESGHPDAITPSEFLEALDDMAHVTQYIRTLDIGPDLVGDTQWLSPKWTQLTPCTLYSILHCLPRLDTLLISCFTWTSCTKKHTCMPAPAPRPFKGLLVQHMRVKGDVDPGLLFNVASSVNTLFYSDVLTTSLVTPCGVGPLALTNVRCATFDITLDTLWIRDPNGRIKILRYDSHQLARRSVEGNTLLDCVKLSWVVTHSQRGALLAFYERVLNTERFCQSPTADFPCTWI